MAALDVSDGSESLDPNLESHYHDANSGVPQYDSDHDEEYEEEYVDDANRERRFLWFQAAPSWLVSMIVHVLIIVVVALIPLSASIEEINVLSISRPAEDLEIQEQIPLEVPEELEEPVEEDEEPIDIEETPEPLEQEDVTEPIELPTENPVNLAVVLDDIAPPDGIESSLKPSKADLDSRNPKTKAALLKEYGGNEDSEAAIEKGLRWMANHQHRVNGGWTFNHRLICNLPQCDHPGNHDQTDTAGATGLAMLSFLGAGNTHNTGKYKDTVSKAVLHLRAIGKRESYQGFPTLNFAPGKAQNLYSHGIATLALAELYAMTEDYALEEMTTLALNHIMAAQGSNGGWQYGPRDPGSDVSSTGWQITALKSGYMGNIPIRREILERASSFLDSVQYNGGAEYGYNAPQFQHLSNTATGLLCRMYLGWGQENPSLVKGVEILAKTGISKHDIYYDYYASQVLRHYGGQLWDSFNIKMRDYLVSSQVKKGPADGSWFFVPPPTDSLMTTVNNAGGRLYCTAMAIMILEVYYRHMPIYASASTEDDFEL